MVEHLDASVSFSFRGNFVIVPGRPATALSKRPLH